MFLLPKTVNYIFPVDHIRLWVQDSLHDYGFKHAGGADLDDIVVFILKMAFTGEIETYSFNPKDKVLDTSSPFVPFMMSYFISLGYPLSKILEDTDVQELFLVALDESIAELVAGLKDFIKDIYLPQNIINAKIHKWVGDDAVLIKGELDYDLPF